jgi:hypothetical protein
VQCVLMLSIIMLTIDVLSAFQVRLIKSSFMVLSVSTPSVIILLFIMLSSSGKFLSMVMLPLC